MDNHLETYLNNALIGLQMCRVNLLDSNHHAGAVESLLLFDIITSQVELARKIEQLLNAHCTDKKESSDHE
jgi:hypothetical protein